MWWNCILSSYTTWKCPYLKIFWSVFLRIQAEYGTENAEYGLFLRSAYFVVAQVFAGHIFQVSLFSSWTCSQQLIAQPNDRKGHVEKHQVTMFSVKPSGSVLASFTFLRMVLLRVYLYVKTGSILRLYLLNTMQFNTEYK